MHEDMTVTAMLAWFNEDPATLHRAVTSLKHIADDLVAIDGGWDLYPGARPSSPPEQTVAIREAAEAAGIQPHIYPGQQWTSQVQKRHRMLWLACNHSDWVMPIDADWEIHADNRAHVRHQLATTQADALIVPFHTPINHDADLNTVAAGQWHKDLAGKTLDMPLIWRVLKDMRYEDFHWHISGVKNDQRVALWGNSGYPQATTEQLGVPFRIDHHCFFRDQRTIQANRAYCDKRAAHVNRHGTEPT